MGKHEEAQARHGIFINSACITIGCERVFGLTVVWAHLCQACFLTLQETVSKVVLLVDISKDWPYTFVQLNDAMSYAPL